MVFGRSILAAAKTLALDVEALAAPAACLGCERPLARGDAADACCAACRHRMRRIAPPKCRRCGQPLDRWSAQWEAAGAVQTRRRAPGAPGTSGAETVHCEFCAEWPGELAWAASAVWLEDGPARNLVYALKYGGWRIAAAPMAAILVVETGAALRGLDALVPVPLGRVRLRERGHNQAAVLAAALGKASSLPVIDGALRRTRETPTQTRLAPTQRRANVGGAFGPVGARLSGMHVALVDDVVTTGATLGAAAQALATLEPASIGALTFARALVPA
jgi:ComF family protein